MMPSGVEHRVNGSSNLSGINEGKDSDDGIGHTEIVDGAEDDGIDDSNAEGVDQVNAFIESQWNQ
jgi:hypothetical protein